MRSKSLKFWSLFTLLLAMAGVARGQVVHAAREGSAPIQVGGGVSEWKSDWGPSPMIGITGQADFYPSVPGMLHGLGFEAEYRIVTFRRTVQPSNFRQQTMGGGPIYTFPYRNRFRFYAKYLVEFGTMDFKTGIPSYTHDSRTVYAPGGGAQYRLHNNFWLRADYEYQIWQQMFKAGKHPTPNGLTVGVAYDLRSLMRH